MNVIKFIRNKQYLICDNGDFTNGHWLIKKEYTPNNLKKLYAKFYDKDKFKIPETSYVWRSALRSDFFSEIDELPFKEDVITGVKVYYFYDKKRKYVILDKSYVDYLKKNIKDFNMKIEEDFDKYSTVILFSGDIIIGLLMQFRDRR